MILKLDTIKSLKALNETPLPSESLEASLLIPLIDGKFGVSNGSFYVFLPSNYDNDVLYEFGRGGAIYSKPPYNLEAIRKLSRQSFQEFKDFISSKYGDITLLLEDTLIGLAPRLMNLFEYREFSEIAYYTLKENSAPAIKDSLFASSKAGPMTVLYILTCPGSTFLQKFGQSPFQDMAAVVLDNIEAFAMPIYDGETMILWSRKNLQTTS